MNEGYYKKTLPGTPIYQGGTTIPNQQYLSDDLPSEQSYIENILRINKGKRVEIYMTFPDASDKDKIFVGIIEQAGRDHIILSDPTTGKWYLLLMIYVDYIKFDEKINYSKEFLPN